MLAALLVSFCLALVLAEPGAYYNVISPPLIISPSLDGNMHAYKV